MVQATEVFAGGGLAINLAAAVGLLLGGAKLFQLFRGGNGTAQLRRDLKEDHADQLQLLAVRIELVIKDAVREALRE